LNTVYVIGDKAPNMAYMDVKGKLQLHEISPGYVRGADGQGL